MIDHIDVSYLKGLLKADKAKSLRHRNKKAKMGFVEKEAPLKKYEQIIIILTLIFNFKWRRSISTIDIALNLFRFLARKPTFLQDKVQDPSWITRELCGLPPNVLPHHQSPVPGVVLPAALLAVPEDVQR